MATLALVDAGLDPGFLIGGELRALGTNAGWGGGDWAVVEADESDRSFLKISREVAVVTSLELDHHATYRSLGEAGGGVRELRRARASWPCSARTWSSSRVDGA